jgi:hypothetical protein
LEHGFHCIAIVLITPLKIVDSHDTIQSLGNTIDGARALTGSLADLGPSAAAGGTVVHIGAQLIAGLRRSSVRAGFAVGFLADQLAC